MNLVGAARPGSPARKPGPEARRRRQTGSRVVGFGLFVKFVDNYKNITPELFFTLSMISMLTN